MAIEHIQVVSSNVESVSFEPEKNTLTVYFRNGSAYEYYNVPETAFAELKLADSVGRYINAAIKPNYAFQRKI